MGAKRNSFKVQHKNFDILIFTVFIYIDLGLLKALLNKYTDPSPLYSLSAIFFLFTLISNQKTSLQHFL